MCSSRPYFPVDIDVIPLVLSFLLDRQDLFNAALVNKAVYRAGIPYLYESLDSRLWDSPKGLAVHHAAKTLLLHPEYALYVRRVKENGSVHGAPQSSSQHILQLALSALKLCKNIRSFSWVDDNRLPDVVFISFLEVLLTLPTLQELTIRTFGNLGDAVWSKLHQFNHLKRVAIFCMEGPPRVLQGWSESLGPSLTSLELGRCNGVPATILINIFSHLRNLTYLRIKGAPSSAIPYILPYLPFLLSLDTDYTESVAAVRAPPNAQLMPRLQKLMLRTSSIDNGGPRGLWPWIAHIIPRTALQTLRLQAFSTLGETSVPRGFLMFLAETHGSEFRKFSVGSTMLQLTDAAFLCDNLNFPNLEEISCSIYNADARAINDVTSHAYNLRSLRITNGTSSAFTLDDVRNLMLRDQSRLRVIAIGKDMYRGEWVYDPREILTNRVKFKVERLDVRDFKLDM